MHNIHISIVGQMYTEKKLYDFLMKYATNDEITEMHYYMDDDMIDQLDMLIEQIMQRIKDGPKGLSSYTDNK